jgi:outer membrane protein assembly factor BamD (BamD/ComL family)
MNYTKRLRIIKKLVNMELDFVDMVLEKTKSPEDQKDTYRNFLLNLYEDMSDNILKEAWENAVKKYQKLL